MKRKILIVEFWGVGDLAFSTLLIRQLLAADYEVHVVGKGYALPLLAPTFPEVRFYSIDVPWSKFTGKYRLWTWNWRELSSLALQLRHEAFDAAVSVRNDPRDHLFMMLTGARERYGFPTKGSQVFLTHPVTRSAEKQHKVEDWRDIGTALGLNGMATIDPLLTPVAYESSRINDLLGDVGKPIVCLHTGARISVRRWPEPYFKELIQRLRQEFDFHLVLIPDPDGYGTQLAPMADTLLAQLTLGELVDVLGRANLMLCNDSGPAHIAAATGRPSIAMFGPTDPDWFRPWGAIQKVIIRDICPKRPCFDYCEFPEPYCMTKLFPDDIWPEVRTHIMGLINIGVLPRNFIKGVTTSAV